ncbi:MAG TPA: VanZ family protein [Gemmatimonadales bacterium]|nr:VanZ family protein [Gemmatimonadales bacterium]
MSPDQDVPSRAWVALVLWLVLQVTLTSLPGKAIPVDLPHPLDWLGHASLYAGIGGLVARVGVLRRWPSRRLVVAGILLSAWAALDELHQLFIPGRDAEVSDWVSDTVGGALGLYVGMRLMNSRFARWLR